MAQLRLSKGQMKDYVLNPDTGLYEHRPKSRTSDVKVVSGRDARDAGLQWQSDVVRECYALHVDGLGFIEEVAPATDTIRVETKRRGWMNFQIQRTPKDEAHRIVSTGTPDFMGILHGHSILFDAKTVGTGDVFRVPTEGKDQLDRLRRFFDFGGVSGYYVKFIEYELKLWFNVSLFDKKFTVRMRDGFIVSDLREVITEETWNQK